jgi:XTP/dITP diphosphohydrolase
MEVLIASNNPDKIREIRKIFMFPNVHFCSLQEFPDAPVVEEDGNTLYKNALKKAKMLSEYTGLSAIADDTGLEVSALENRPGVYSARFAGEQASYDDNIDKLLFEMQSVPEKCRQARFRTVAIFYHPSLVLSAEGMVSGIILRERRGNLGFGYDPVFYIPAYDKTFAEMTDAEKNNISHRGQAFQQLKIGLQSKLKQLSSQT